MFNCIMKMDYNAAVYLFLYYLWYNRQDSRHNKAVTIILIPYPLLKFISFIFTIFSKFFYNYLNHKSSTFLTLLFLKFFYANGAFMLFDVFWFLINMKSWGNEFTEEGYNIWTSFRVYRIFTLVLCCVIFLLKVLFEI